MYFEYGFSFFLMDSSRLIRQRGFTLIVRRLGTLSHAFLFLSFFKFVGFFLYTADEHKGIK